MTEEMRNDELQAEESAEEQKEEQKTEHVYVTDIRTEDQNLASPGEDSADEESHEPETDEASDEPETMESMLEMYGDGEEIQRGKVVRELWSTLWTAAGSSTWGTNAKDFSPPRNGLTGFWWKTPMNPK